MHKDILTNNSRLDYVSASNCPTLVFSDDYAGNGKKTWGKFFYFDYEWVFTRMDKAGDIDWNMAKYEYLPRVLEFFGNEKFWDKEYEVVQNGERKWTGTVYVKYNPTSSDVPFYGYQVSDSKKQGKAYGNFQIGDTLTMKSCIDSIEQGINYSLLRK